MPALVSGGAVPASQRGKKLDGLMTIWDLYATFGEAAGLSSSQAVEDAEAAKANLPKVDSISQWSYWMGKQQMPSRTELAIGGALNNAHGASDQYLPTTVEGLITTENATMWKLLFGYHVQEAIWTGPQFPNSSSKPSDWNTEVDCTTGCLFNLTHDPEERNDLASVRPDKVTEMVARIAWHNDTVFSPRRGSKDPRACKTALAEFGGFWGPFE